MPATLFFDLDNTLCHPTVPFTQIFSANCGPLLEGLADAHISALLHAWDAALEAPGHSTMPACLERALAAAGIAASERLIEQCARALTDEWAATQRLGDGVMETLTHLGQSHPLGLITNGPDDGQRAVIAALRLDEVFRWCIVSGDATVGIRKPDPRIFQHALALSGSTPRDTWYTGDSLVKDMSGAATAGWRTCWIGPKDEPFAPDLPHPDAHIVRLEELPQIIAGYGYE